MFDVELIIKTGDRADLKKYLAICTDNELVADWVRLSCCGVQDFQQLVSVEMQRRKMIHSMEPLNARN